MKSLTLLWKEVALDYATRCCTSATHDINTVMCRYEHEGFSFLTITLPTFGKAFERGLDLGYVDRSSFPSFRFGSRDKKGLPLFLEGFLGQVFDRTSGRLLDEPNIDAILAVRQLTLMFGKLFLLSTRARERQAMIGYLECEKEVAEADACRPLSLKEDFKRVSSMLYSKAFTEMDREIYNGAMVPQHGPGATADRLSGNGKYRQTTWPARLEVYFPSSEYIIPNYSYWEELDNVYSLEPGDEIPVRVISVPKTQKTPRIIGIEPTAMQYAQQAILPVMLRSLKVGRLSRMLGFDDQTPNQRMARQGSQDGSLATLDLSEASDRVSNELVQIMMSNHPHLQGAVQASRSRRASVLGKVVDLHKFASMGSALCFPMEAMVFLTVVFVGIQKELSTPLSREVLIRDFLGRVRIFGDDIIVPAEYVLSVIHELENFGLRVNVHKSFWTGRFRESCGREYYDGEDVSIVRVRRVLPRSRQDATGVISAVALRNQAYWSGLWSTARWLDSYLTKLLREFPTVGPDSPVLGRESALGYQFQRLDPNTHSPLVKGYYVRAKAPLDHLEGEGALLKCLIGNPDEPDRKDWDSLRAVLFDVASVDDEHLERSGRPEHVSIKLGWRPPY